MPIDKQPIYRGDDKLLEVRGFVPKDMVVVGLVAQSKDGSRDVYPVHYVQHVFEKSE